jgi:4-amino-4-deoxy-L-arabinose transferase-like glycosyltransferase
MLTLNNPKQLNHSLYFFIFIHVIAWTFVPFCVRHTLPMDALEGTIWGQQFEWGYDKNPFLNGWLTALAILLGGHSGWTIYLFSQISVGICFWAVWQLGKKMLMPVYALLAVLLLEGVQYYNLHAIDFDDNTLELSLWALTALYFYQALKSHSYRDWVLTGLFAGLGMMTKYYTGMLLLPMALFLLMNKDNHDSFKKGSTYVGLLVFTLIILPHCVWLFFHDFVTLSYAINRVSATPTWLNHIDFAALFAWEQLKAFIPAILLSFILLGKKPLLNTPRSKLSSFDKQFLFYVGLGPFLLTIILSIVTGMRLRAGWGAPLLSLWGIIFIAWLQPRVTPARFKRFLIAFYTLFAIVLISYASALIRASAPSSANFPGRDIAETLTAEWHNTYHKPLHYVAGSRWLAGNIAFYSNDHPAVFINWDKKLSPWINIEKMKKEGAIFVWDLSEDNPKLPEEIITQYANLSKLRILYFTWLRNKDMKPIEVRFAFLPPADENS